MNPNGFVRIIEGYRALRVPPSDRDLLYLQALAARPDDRRLENAVNLRLLRATLDHGLWGSPLAVPSAMSGSLLLGEHPGGPAWVELGGPQAHILQAAISGGGKTCTDYFLLLQLAHSAQGLWVIEFGKREYRHLVPLFAREGKRLYVCRAEQLCLNPLASPDEKIDPASWDSILVDMAALALRFPLASRNLFLTRLRDLQESKGVSSGRDCPTLFELRDAVSRGPGSSQLKATILNRLDAVLTELGPDVLGQATGFPIPDLANECIVFELDGRSYLAQNLLCTYLLGSLFAYRAACPEGRRGPVIFCLDEAQRVYSQRAETASAEGPSYLSTMTSLVRGADVTLMVNVQTTYDLSRSIMANSSIKVMGRLGEHDDYVTFGRSMGMAGEQIEFCKRTLRPGLYAARVGGGDFQEPFLLRVPLVTVPGRVSDEEVRRSGEELRRKLLSERQPSQKPHPLAALPPAKEPLAPEEELLLNAVRDHSQRPWRQYPRLVGMSNRKAAQVRESLVKKGRLKEWRVELSGRGARTLLLEVLEGEEGSGADKGHPGRKGSFPHQLGVRLVRERLEADGYDVQLEKGFPVNDETTYLDVFGKSKSSGEMVGVEVETEAGHALENLRMALEVGLDRVIVVACSQQVKQALLTLASEEFTPEQLADVTVSTLSDYWDGRAG